MVISTPFGGLGLDIDKFFSQTTSAPTYPPHNVIKFTDDEYVLQFAVAGFKKPDIEITTKDGNLHVSGYMAEPQFDEGQGYVHKGIAGRKFKRAFTLPDYFEVDGATMEDGILNISLIKNVPEEQKPKQIAID
jgi:molecular chaperone IbpA